MITALRKRSFESWRLGFHWLPTVACWGLSASRRTKSTTKTNFGSCCHLVVAVFAVVRTATSTAGNRTGAIAASLRTAGHLA